MSTPLSSVHIQFFFQPGLCELTTHTLHLKETAFTQRTATDTAMGDVTEEAKAKAAEAKAAGTAAYKAKKFDDALAKVG